MPDLPPNPPRSPFTNGLPAPTPRRSQTLSLPRRTHTGLTPPPLGGLISLAYADTPPEVQRRVEARLNSRSPFPSAAAQPPTHTAAERTRLLEIENAYRAREHELSERERAMEELQARLKEREREMAEIENLLLARERVLMVQRKAPTMPPFAANAEETTALEKLRAALDLQETSLAESRSALREREAFIEQSEITLMNKVAAQQEHEIMLEQRYENLRRAENELRERVGQVDPAVAAEIEADRKRKRDEFTE
ncbi:MAG: hypothetical protein EAZ36_01245 [Verrucomicrobia bacterium]|nr:MAG: hypothetical protein EAZ36_01245 [Verrucomicrobiota bacterium]